MLHSIRAIALLLLAVVATSHAEHVEVCRYCGGTHGQMANDSGDDDDALKYPPDRLVDVTNIRIDVTPDFDKRTVSGETTIDFAPISRPVREVKLNAVDLDIADVRASRQIEDYIATDRHLTILFADPIPVGEATSVAIRHASEPTAGLYFRTEEMGYPKGDDHIWTQGEPHEAPHWFPCFDYPNGRSSTEVICRVPRDMTVLSNGRVVGEGIDEATGLKVVHWRQEKPHVTYLICLVAGYFEHLEKQHGDLRLRFYTQPSLFEHAANSFADTDQIIAFFEQEIGVAFPWDKYDQVTIRDFNSGGMENTSLTTLTHRTIFSNETETVYSSRPLDAHETAHQWFGDLVTCEDWSHLWLNEGFATYYTHLYIGHRLGRDEMLNGLYRDAQNRVLSKKNDTRPIVYRGYKNPWEQFDFRAYPKGSWVLHMLRNQLGEDVYRRAIRNYLQKHELSSVVTADLRAELEDASGLELDRFFDQWVYHGGVPRLKITYKWLPKKKLAHVQIKQTQETSDEVMLFHLPTKLRFQLPSGSVDHEIEITDDSQDFYVPLAEKPRAVRFDPEYTLLAEVDFDKSMELLEAQLGLADDMIGRRMAVKALGEKTSRRSTEMLATVLDNDPFYAVRAAAAKALGKQQTDYAFEKLMAASPIQGKFPSQDARVRVAMTRAIGGYYRDESLEWLKQVATSQANPAVVAAAIEQLGKYGDRAADTVLAALDRASFENEIALAAVEAIGKLGDEKYAEALLAKIEDRYAYPGRYYARLLPITAKLLRQGETNDRALELFLSLVSDKARRVQQGAIKALGELGDRRAQGVLARMAESSNGRVAESARNALKKLDEDAPAVPEELTELRELVRDLKQEQGELREKVESLETAS